MTSALGSISGHASTRKRSCRSFPLLDTGVLPGTQAYNNFDQAVEDAAQANDALVLLLVIQGIAT